MSPFLLVLLAFILSALYSLPPFRLKRFPFAATGLLGLLSVAVFLAGFSLFAGGRAFHLAPHGVLLFLLFGVTIGFTAKDLKDRAGDAAEGVKTLPVLLGEKKGRRTTAFLVAAGFLSSLVFLPIPRLWAVAVPFAAAGFWITLRSKRPDRPLLLLYLPFACILFGLLFARPEVIGNRPDLEGWGNASGARNALLRSEHEKAVRLFGESEEADGGNAVSLFPLHRGMALARAGETERAVPFLREAIAALSSESRGWTDLAECHYRAGRIAEARAVLEEMLLRRVDPREACRRLAGISLETGDLSLARRAIEAGFAHGGREELTAVQAGDLLVLSGEADLSLPWYERALRYDPRSSEAWAGLGRAHHAGGRLGEAREAFAEALLLDPDDGVIANNAGVVARDMGDDDAAFLFFRRAAEREPELVQARMNLGMLFESRGETDRAREEYRRVLRIAPAYPPALDRIERTRR